MLKVGIGREVITPEIGGHLYGYSPETISTSVHDNLTVTAFVFEGGAVRSVLLSVSVCLIQTELSDEIRETISRVALVPATHVVVAVTHTHSGPRTDSSAGWGALDRTYCNLILLPRCVAATKAALHALQPAVMGIGRTDSRVGINRRELTPDGRIKLGQNEWGSFDPAMTLLALRGADGKPLANLIHYGAHCTAAGNNGEITRDWAGVMTDIVERETGGMAAFINGAEGDVGPRLTNGKTTGDIRYVQEHGALAAHDAMRAFRSITEWIDVEPEVIMGDLRIPFVPILPEAKARELLGQYREKPAGNLPLQTYNTLSEILELHRKGVSCQSEFRIQQTMLRIGPVMLVPAPFEVFSAISLQIRKLSPWPHTLVLSGANGSETYLPSENQLCLGGYEIDSFRWYKPHRLPDNADNLFIGEILRILSACR